MGDKRRKRLFCALLAAILLASCLLVPFFWGRAAEIFAPRGSRVRLLTIMYHALCENPADAGEYVCPVGQVESDLIWLQEHGFQSVTGEELIAFANGTGTLPEKPVLLTLDDGCKNNVTLLSPLLEDCGMTAVLAVVGEYADIYSACGDDGSPFVCLSWAEAKQAADSPLFEVAGHSYYFHHLSGRKGAARRRGESESDWRAALRSDTVQLRQAFSDHGLPAPDIYAYPYGLISEGADALLQELGFSVTLSCYEQQSELVSGQPESLLSLGRFNRDGRLTTADFMRRASAP